MEILLNNSQNLDPYKDFTARLRLFIKKRPDLIATTLGNINFLREQSS